MSETLAIPPELRAMNAAHAEHIRPAFALWTAAITSAREMPEKADGLAIEAVQALEQIAKVASASAKELRLTIHAEMMVTGIVSVDGENYVGRHTEEPRRLVVLDEAKVRAARPDLFKPQPDQLDRKELAAILRAGKHVEGAELSNGGPGHLTISGKKK